MNDLEVKLTVVFAQQGIEAEEDSTLPDASLWGSFAEDKTEDGSGCLGKWAEVCTFRGLDQCGRNNSLGEEYCCEVAA